jgi:hypothetical protein
VTDFNVKQENLEDCLGRLIIDDDCCRYFSGSARATLEVQVNLRHSAKARNLTALTGWRFLNAIQRRDSSKVYSISHRRYLSLQRAGIENDLHSDWT